MCTQQKQYIRRASDTRLSQKKPVDTNTTRNTGTVNKKLDQQQTAIVTSNSKANGRTAYRVGLSGRISVSVGGVPSNNYQASSHCQGFKLLGSISLNDGSSNPNALRVNPKRPLLPYAVFTDRLASSNLVNLAAKIVPCEAYDPGKQLIASLQCFVNAFAAVTSRHHSPHQPIDNKPNKLYHDHNMKGNAAFNTATAISTKTSKICSGTASKVRKSGDPLCPR
jgi:hypothetical protein